MKIVHLVALALVFLAVLFAFLGQLKVAGGMLFLSTVVEIIGSAVSGKKQNV